MYRVRVELLREDGMIEDGFEVSFGGRELAMSMLNTFRRHVTATGRTPDEIKRESIDFENAWMDLRRNIRKLGVGSVAMLKLMKELEEKWRK